MVHPMHSLQPGASTPKRWTPGVAAQPTPQLALAEQRLLQQLMAQSEDEDIAALMGRSAAQLSLLSGWRWAAVARFVDGGRSAQLLAFADRGKVLPGLTYELAMTPCREVEQAETVHHIANVSERFPEDADSVEMGVLHYAGLVYRRGNEVLGHVFVMHDQALTPSMAHQVDPLLQLSALHIGSRMELSGLRDLLREWQGLADTDELTQLPNRRAFEREMALQASLVASGAREDSLLAILDVDGLKRVNDSRGHPEGDALLRAVTQALRSTLRRGQDRLFRLGGDEFAMLVDAPKSHTETQLQLRTEPWQQFIHAAGFPEAGLSLGVARLSEANGQRSAWMQLADERMYLHKGARRR